MSFEQMVNEERDRLDEENMASERRIKTAFEKKCEELKPMLEQLNNGVNQIGLALRFVLHTDKKHFPCPAIHLDLSNNRSGSTLYEEFGEIFKSDYDGDNRLDQKIWKMGACNMHRHSAKDDNDLLSFVAKTIAKKCYDRRKW